MEVKRDRPENEPTREMIKAGVAAWSAWNDTDADAEDLVVSVYLAMTAATSEKEAQKESPSLQPR